MTELVLTPTEARIFDRMLERSADLSTWTTQTLAARAERVDPLDVFSHMVLPTDPSAEKWCATGHFGAAYAECGVEIPDLYYRQETQREAFYETPLVQKIELALSNDGYYRRRLWQLNDNTPFAVVRATLLELRANARIEEDSDV